MKRLALVALAAAASLLAGEPRVQAGFDHFYNLEYDEAISTFRGLIARDTSNPDYRNHLAETILYRELFRVGALESELVTGSNPFLRRPKMNPGPEVEREFLGAISTAMSLCEKRLKENPNDTGALYTLGVSCGLRANYDFIVRKAWMDALRDATRSRKLHAQVTKLDPDNIDARMVQAVHEYVVASLPWYYRVLGFLAGFSGKPQSRGSALPALHCLPARAAPGRRGPDPESARPGLPEELPSANGNGTDVQRSRGERQRSGGSS